VTDDAWANFIAQLDPTSLERERMRVHGDLDAERPGGRQDHEMRFAHDYLRDQRNARADTDRARIRHERDEADADRAIWHQKLRRRITDEELEAAIANYQQQNEAAHAAYRNRRTAA
jgi:hypothetical protein